MKSIRSKITFSFSILFLTLLFTFLPKKAVTQTISIECPDGDTHTCYTDGQRTVYKGNGVTKITVIK